MHLPAACILLSLHEEKRYCAALIADETAPVFDRSMVRTYFNYALASKQMRYHKRAKGESLQHWAQRIQSRYHRSGVQPEKVMPGKVQVDDHRKFDGWTAYHLQQVFRRDLIPAAIFVEVCRSLKNNLEQNSNELCRILHGCYGRWTPEKWERELHRMFTFRNKPFPLPQQKYPAAFWRDLVTFGQGKSWSQWLPEEFSLQEEPVRETPSPDQPKRSSVDTLLPRKMLLGMSLVAMFFLVCLSVLPTVETQEISDPQEPSTVRTPPIEVSQLDVGQFGLVPIWQIPTHRRYRKDPTTELISPLPVPLLRPSD